MKLIQNSDIFDYLNKDDHLKDKITKVLGSMSGAIILNNNIKKELDMLQRLYKEQSVIAIIKEIRENNILLVKIPVAYKFPTCLPFIKYKKEGKPKLVINLTDYIKEKKDMDTNEVEYSIDIKQLYVLCLSGFIYYKLLEENVTLPPDVIKTSSIIWSRMFNKVLIKTIGLNTNKERYEAFMYFGMRFFMKYYLDSPDVVIENISNSYLKNGKTYLISHMEEKIKYLNVDINESFDKFCHTLFNNEVSNIKGIKVNNVADALNRQSYLAKFIEMYGFASLCSLGSYPYFLFVIISSFNWSKICADRSLEDIVFYDSKEMPKLLSSIYKELF
jgi:hypothetical protein